MKNVNRRRPRLSVARTLPLLPLLLIAFSASPARAQWTQADSNQNIHTTNSGNVEVGSGSGTPSERLINRGNAVFGGPGARTELWPTFTSSYNPALFELNSGAPVSNDTRFAALSLVTNQSGAANAVGGIYFANGALTGSDKRVAQISVATDGPLSGGASGAMSFVTAGGGSLAERVRITGGGNVGIGTATPSARLVVAGSSSDPNAMPGFKVENSADSLARGVRVQNYYPGITYFTANTYRDPTGGGSWRLDNATRGSAGMILNTEDWLPGIGNYLQLWAAPNGVAGGLPSLVVWDSKKLSVNKPVSTDTRGAPGLVDILGTGFTPATASLAVSNSNSVSLLFVRDDGNVGVGTTSPGSSLQVNGGAAIGYGAATTAPSNGLAVSGSVGIGKSNPTVALDVVGDIAATGNISAKYQDVAEWVPSSQKLQAGTVVVLDSDHTNQVLASSKEYDTKVAGVVSAQPGISLGQGGDGKLLVATTGRVKVKVDATRAPIKVGDLLVTSGVEGVAMKSVPVDLGGARIHRPGTIIGKALEPLASGTGEILVLLSLQ